MTKQEILAAIEEYIKTNGLQKINGQILNYILTSITTIIPDESMIKSSFGGIVSPSTSIIVEPNSQKWFFANPGTYPNAGNLILPSGFINILSFNGSAWEKNSIDVPASDIKNFSDLNFPVLGGTKFIYQDSIWQVKQGEIGNNTDVPSFDVNSKYKSLGLNLNSNFKNYLNPTLEVGGIGLTTGVTDSTTTLRGRTASFIDISNLAQLELIGDMLFQSIFYYTDAGGFVSRQDINAKIFIPNFPGTATKGKISFFHAVNTQVVTQVELNALTVNCYSATPITMKKVVENSTNAAKITDDYNSFNVNLGEKVAKELGRLVVSTGANASSTTGIRTDLITVYPGENTITVPTGYRTSRVVNFKDGVYVENNVTFSGVKFNIPDTGAVNQVKIVFEKLPDGTTVITDSEVLAFKFSLTNPNYNKYIQLANQANKEAPVKDLIYTKNEQLTILNTKDTDINFDLLNRKLIISGGAIIDMGNTTVGRLVLPISSIGTDMPSAITAGVVLLNRNNNSIVIQTQTAAPLINHYVLFTYQYNGDPASFYVTGLKNYSVNGSPVSQKDIRSSNRFAVDNFAIPYWRAKPQDAIDPNTINSTFIYDLYDTIISQFPSGVTKTILGQTEGPIPYDIWRLDISFNRRSPANQRRRKPRIFVCGGTHGGEKLASYTTYLFFKYLISNPDDDEMLTILKTAFDWTFIPIVNPFALNSGGNARWNHNGVDINRNFDYRWDAFTAGNTPGTDVYKGTAPFSEKESQFVRDVFNAIKSDTVLYIDCHNFGSAGLTDGARCLWLATTFNTPQNAVYALCDRIDMEFKKKYFYIPKSTLIAFSDVDTTSPMSQSWISNQQVLGMTLETDQSDFFNNPSPSFNFNSNVITRSIEAYVNAFYSLGKHAVEIYNNRI